MRHKGLKILWLVSAVIIVLCIVRAMLPHKTISYDWDELRFSTDSRTDLLLERNIALSPGIWTVTVKCTPSSDMTSIVTLRDDSLSESLLQTNGGNVHVGIEEQKFYVFLYASTEKAELFLECDDRDIAVYGAEIEETSLLWIRITAIVLFLNACIYAVVRLLGEGGPFASEKGRKVFLLVTIIGVLSSLPYLTRSLIAGGDLFYHLHRIEGVRASILSGIFPSRLEPHWQQGYGYANGLFYCPLYIYIPGIMRCIGFTVSEAYRAYCILFSFITAWIAYYSYSRIFKRADIGVACSALYSLSIIHYNKLVASANVGEGTAITFLPLILLSIYELFFAEKEEDKPVSNRAWISLTIGMTGIIQCHVLSCEMTAFVLLVTGAVFIKRFIKRKCLWSVVKAALWTCAMCLWYLIPFLDYYLTQDVAIKYASARTIQGRGVYPATHMINFWSYGENGFISETGMKGFYQRGIGLFFVVALAIYFVLLIGRKTSADSKSALKAYSVYSFGASVVLFIMSLAVFPWDWIQFSSPILESLISSLQFPVRWFDFGTAFAVVIAGYLLVEFKEKWHRAGYYAGVFAIIISVVTASAFINDVINTVPGRAYIYNGEAFGMGYISGGEYVLRGSDPNKYLYNNYVAGEGVEILKFSSGPLSAETMVRNDSSKESWIEVPLAFYKGYRAYSDKGELDVLRGDNAVIRVPVPAGYQGNVKVKFVSPWYWRVSEIISLIAYVAAAVLIWRSFCAKKRRVYETEQS